MKIVNGDLLTSGCDLIVHQLNCLTVRSLGLSKAISIKYPYADVYSKRIPIGNKNLCKLESRGNPGNIEICRSEGLLGPIIVGIYGQFSPSVPGKYYTNLGDDTYTLREKWFIEGLDKLFKFIIDNNNYINNKKIQKVGFPYKIGCGLAGGSWNNYKKFIQSFSEKLDQHGVETFIYNF